MSDEKLTNALRQLQDMIDHGMPQKGGAKSGVYNPDIGEELRESPHPLDLFGMLKNYEDENQLSPQQQLQYNELYQKFKYLKDTPSWYDWYGEQMPDTPDLEFYGDNPDLIAPKVKKPEPYYSAPNTTDLVG